MKLQEHIDKLFEIRADWEYGSRPTTILGALYRVQVLSKIGELEGIIMAIDITERLAKEEEDKAHTS